MSALPAELPATFTRDEALAAGLTRHRLYQLRDSGVLEAVGRGLFRRVAEDLTDLELLEAARRAPQATICLLSALARHDLTDAIPARHDLALPRGDWHPRVATVTWHSFAADTFEIGRGTVTVDGETNVGLYDAPRSVVDAYRTRHRVGLETADEALRRWLRSGGQPATLLDVASAFPMTLPTVRRALEILMA